MILFLQNHKVFLHHTPEHRTTLITGEFYSKTGRWRLNDITTCFSTCHVIEQPDNSFGMQKIAVDCGDLIVALQNSDQGSDNAAQGSEHLQDIIYFKSQHLNLHLATCKHYVNLSELQRSCCLQNPLSCSHFYSQPPWTWHHPLEEICAAVTVTSSGPWRITSLWFPRGFFPQIHPQSVTMCAILDHPKRWRKHCASTRLDWFLPWSLAWFFEDRPRTSLTVTSLNRPLQK